MLRRQVCSVPGGPGREPRPPSCLPSSPLRRQADWPRTAEVAVSSTGPWQGVSAAVSGGKGNLSCALAEDEGGATTTIRLQDTKTGGKEWEFTSNFAFVSLPKAVFPVGEIEAKLSSAEGTASGFANFTEPGTPAEKASVVEKCAQNAASELSFETAKQEAPGRAPVVGIEGTIGAE